MCLGIPGRIIEADDGELMRMGKVDAAMPDGLYTHECAMVYDGRHDVCVALIPARFSGPMQTFLYRYAPGP